MTRGDMGVRSHPAAQVRPYALGLLSALLLSCPDSHANRANPICAVQDCKTGEIIDDGCSADGRCKSCINDCGGRVAPRNGAKTSLFPGR